MNTSCELTRAGRVPSDRRAWVDGRVDGSAGAIQTQYTYEPFARRARQCRGSSPFQTRGRRMTHRTYYYRRATTTPAPAVYQRGSDRFLGGDPNLYAYVGNNR